MKAAGPAALIAAEQAEDAGSECPYGRIEPGRGTDRVAHRHRERRGFDLEHAAGLRLDTLAERQRRGAEKWTWTSPGRRKPGYLKWWCSRLRIACDIFASPETKGFSQIVLPSRTMRLAPST